MCAGAAGGWKGDPGARLRGGNRMPGLYTHQPPRPDRSTVPASNTRSLPPPPNLCALTPEQQARASMAELGDGDRSRPTAPQ